MRGRVEDLESLLSKVMPSPKRREGKLVDKLELHG